MLECMLVTSLVFDYKKNCQKIFKHLIAGAWYIYTPPPPKEKATPTAKSFFMQFYTNKAVSSVLTCTFTSSRWHFLLSFITLWKGNAQKYVNVLYPNLIFGIQRYFSVEESRLF